jgi:hypothetical protein
LRQLSTQPLSAEHVIQAFPLIQTALPEVTLAAWRDFAAALMSSRAGPRGGRDDAQGAARGGGILAVTDGRDYIAGLCSYRLVPDLVHGRLLDAGHFLAFDLLDRRPVVEALAKALEAVARECGCTAVHTHLPYRNGAPAEPADGLSGLLAARGHRIETLGLCKRLVA